MTRMTRTFLTPETMQAQRKRKRTKRRVRKRKKRRGKMRRGTKRTFLTPETTRAQPRSNVNCLSLSPAKFNSNVRKVLNT